MGEEKFWVELDKERCIGCGSCMIICSKYFEMDNEGISELKGATKNSKKRTLGSEEEPLKEDIECFETAAQSCPVNCIKVYRIE